MQNLEGELLRPKYGILYICICFNVFHIFFCKMSIVDDQYDTTLEPSKIRLSYLVKDRTWNYWADGESKLTAYERVPVGVHRNNFRRTNRSISERSNWIPAQLQCDSSINRVAWELYPVGWDVFSDWSNKLKAQVKR